VSSRDLILAAVRANQPSLVPALPDVPLFERPAGSLLAEFREALGRMGGKFVEAKQAENLDDCIRSLFPQAQVICSVAPELKGTRALTSTFESADLADVDVGVVRAAFGVAETGSIWLSETELQINPLAFLAQHFVALLVFCR
jgi:L-lactate dehydrogenase complex protein LldG